MICDKNTIDGRLKNCSPVLVDAMGGQAILDDALKSIRQLWKNSVIIGDSGPSAGSADLTSDSMIEEFKKTLKCTLIFDQECAVVEGDWKLKSLSKLHACGTEDMAPVAIAQVLSYFLEAGSMHTKANKGFTPLFKVYSPSPNRVKTESKKVGEIKGMYKEAFKTNGVQILKLDLYDAPGDTVADLLLYPEHIWSNANTDQWRELRDWAFGDAIKSLRSKSPKELTLMFKDSIDDQPGSSISVELVEHLATTTV